MENKKKGGCGRTVISMILICIGVFVCVLTFVIGTDYACGEDVEHWMPVYPNSELVEYRREGFFRPRAMGITEAIYQTNDDVLTVRNWFLDYRRGITEGILTNNSERPARGIATTNYTVSENPEGGSFIYQFAECAYN